MSGNVVPFPPRHRGHIDRLQRELTAHEYMRHADIMDMARTDEVIRALGPTAAREVFRLIASLRHHPPRSRPDALPNGTREQDEPSTLKGRVNQMERENAP